MAALEENIFGKIRGRFDEAAARNAIQEIKNRIVMGFAALSPHERADLIKQFNRVHAHDNCRPKYSIVKEDE